jgi:hypothetical protein
MTQVTHNQAFYALLAMLRSSSTGRSRVHAAAAGFVKAEIIPIIATAFANNPELSAQEVLDLCEPALIKAVTSLIER